MKTVILYLRADRDQAYDKGQKLGFTGEVLSMFSYAGYEHEGTFEVDETTGKVELVAVDGRRLAGK